MYILKNRILIYMAYKEYIEKILFNKKFYSKEQAKRFIEENLIYKHINHTFSETTLNYVFKQNAKDNFRYKYKISIINKNLQLLIGIPKKRNVWFDL